MSRSGKKTVIILVVVFALVIGIFLVVEQQRWNRYQEEYNSTEWYEVTAVYDHCVNYTRREQRTNYRTDDTYYEEVDYYDWYYNYTAKDDSVHVYVDKKNSFEPSGNPTTTILVDENDPSHSLEPRTEETHNWAVRTTLSLLIICMVPSIGMVIVISFLSRALRGNRRR